jgi:hypothetical protein
MAFDYQANRMLLYGGGAYLNDPPKFDAWAWDGVDWTLVADSREPQLPTFGAVSSAPNLGVFLLGPGGKLNADNEEQVATYRWTAGGWVKTDAWGPVGKISPGLTYDPDIAKFLEFGGALSSSGPRATDMWTWDGAAWTKLNPPGQRPMGGVGLMAYDPLHKVVVWFAEDGTWTFDGTFWRQRASVAQSPPFGNWGSMVFDPAHGQVLVTGMMQGTGYGHTFVWDGEKWTAY